jgi:hypothetical protein
MKKEQNSSTVALKEKIEEDHRLFDIVNPDTGKKYDIPLLSSVDPEYYFKYVNFMKLKECSPSAFEAAMRWD